MMPSTILAFSAGALTGIAFGFLLVIFYPRNSDEDGMEGRDDG